jgi:histone-lysine N-methyltransferase SETMAR
VDKIHDVVLTDRPIKMREMAEAVNISYERVFHILYNELDLKKLSARWVPRLLSPEQKRVPVQTSAQCLEMFQRNPTDLKRGFVTMNETYIYSYIPKTKNQSKQWIGPGKPTPKKAKTVHSAGKVMASVFETPKEFC